MSEITILPCTDAYVQSVAELERSAFSDPWSADSLRAMTDSEYYSLICAVCNGALCGYLAASSVAGESEILRIAVHEEYRRRGIGTALLDSFTSQRTAAGDGEFYLEVRASNTPAIGLYASRGFVICGKRANYYKCPSEDAVLMKTSVSATDDK